ncbi:MAG TPA: LLM class flavin-dependent oxidoreductase [Actinomycetota bacterium]
MNLGYGLVTCQRTPGDHRRASDLYGEALELARACEAVGLDSIWTSEHHFFDDDYMPSLLVTSAALAAVTERISVGTGVVLGPLYHPLRLAEDAATVDAISRGRLVLGLGIGWRREEFDRLGIPMEGLGRRLTETVAVLRGAWGPEPFAHEGTTYRIDTTNVTPKPAHGIEILIGGFADRALRRAARIGDGYLASTTRGSDLTRRVRIVMQELERLGRDPSTFRFGVHEPVWVSDNPEADLEDVLRAVWYTRWKYQDMATAFARPSSGPLPKPPPIDAETREQLLKELIIGTPDQVARRIRRTRQILGDDMYYVARSYLPGMSLDRSVREIQLLGEVRKLL